MSRRLLELCLLAYPRARRERDGVYLRDLALELGEAQGLSRQAISLLLGGLRARVECGRRRWAGRAVVACLALFALAVAASPGGGSAHDVEEYACAEEPARLEINSGCTETERVVAAKEREGWNCATHRRPGRRSTTWECTRA
jgi:hypothetical protein